MFQNVAPAKETTANTMCSSFSVNQADRFKSGAQEGRLLDAKEKIVCILSQEKVKEWLLGRSTPEHGYTVKHAGRAASKINRG